MDTNSRDNILEAANSVQGIGAKNTFERPRESGRLSDLKSVDADARGLGRSDWIVF